VPHGRSPASCSAIKEELLRSATSRGANLDQNSPVSLIAPQPLLRRQLESSFGHIDPVDWRPLAMF
jgi:hypothetical protein